MNSFYHKGQIELQIESESESIADRLKETRLHSEFIKDDKEVIESLSFFFLATADEHGNPDCSYKGGEVGFVKVMTTRMLVFPDFDGNGMFRSLGNINVNPSVGLLFVSFSGDKRRIRVNGKAEIKTDSNLLNLYPEATRVVVVTPTHIFPNCPRYIPEMKITNESVFIPKYGQSTPEPFWKSKPDLEDFVPKRNKR